MKFYDANECKTFATTVFRFNEHLLKNPKINIRMLGMQYIGFLCNEYLKFGNMTALYYDFFFFFFDAEKIYDGTLRYNTSTEWVNDQSYRDGGYVKVSCTIQNVNTENILAVYEVDFYDFEATVLLPPDEGGNYVTTTVQDSTTSNSTLSTTVKNNTANAQTASVTTSASLSSTASHTREGGKDLTFKESLNVSVEEEFSVGVESLSESTKFGVNVGFEATQLIKKSFSDTTGETKTDEKAITETITLPPHTQALMTTESSKSTITSKYNSPFAMNYTARVTIKYNTQGPTKNYSYYSHTSNGQTATYTFDATARSDLYQRAIIEGGTNYDSEGINWVKAREKEKITWKIEKHNIYTYYDTLGGKTVKRTHTEHYIDGSETVDPVILCATCLPMMDTPAQFTQKVEGTKISYSLWTTLPLASIKVLPPESITFISTGGSVYGNYNCQTADMNIGDSFRTSQLNLIGLDTDNVEFYNFSKNNGHWVIADESGEELTGDDLPVELVDEYGTVVNAVRPGTCYLKYVIDENCYAVADNRTGFIKNTDLTGGTAGIKINVKNPPVTITVENNYTNGTVDADWDYLDADDNTDTTRFFVTCVDNNDNGKFLDYEWEAMQTKRRGIEITKENCATLYDDFKPIPGKVNIVTLHGRLGSSPDEDVVVLKKLADRGIDYLALGHIHAWKKAPLDSRGTFCYPGCLEGRGFDESGPHGFALLEIDEQRNTMTHRFVPFAQRALYTVDVDVTGCLTTAEMEERVKAALREAGCGSGDMADVTMRGELDVECEKDAGYLRTGLEARFFFARLQDRTTLRIDPQEYLYDESLRGEFVRVVLADSSIPEEEKTAVIRCGFQAMDGEALL